jgi:hypothetical protein
LSGASTPRLTIRFDKIVSHFMACQRHRARFARTLAHGTPAEAKQPKSQATQTFLKQIGRLPATTTDIREWRFDVDSLSTACSRIALALVHGRKKLGGPSYFWLRRKAELKNWRGLPACGASSA